MKAPDSLQRDFFLVSQIAVAISVISFFYQLQHGNVLLYGDAVAHINIARRVFDSRTPGLLQLGTVWLPLPHLLILPFLVSKKLWQTGIGGSVPSLIGYVLSVCGIFRLMQAVFGKACNSGSARFAVWLAVAIFAANPNLIYLQTTAMSEAVYLPLSIWAIVFLVRALRWCSDNDPVSGNSDLVKCGLCLGGASLTRYDGWLLGGVLAVVSLWLTFAGKSTSLRRGAVILALLAAAAPALWVGYNAAVYGNPLEFANGPYSARAIEVRSNPPGMAAHPGSHDLPVAFRYFFKSAELNLAAGKLQIFWVVALLLGTGIVLLFQRRLWPLLLLWIPVPFYMLSIAYSGVPLFVATWWPFSTYNVRYGIELLPAFAVLTAAAAYGLMRFAAQPKTRLTIAIGFIAVVAGSYVEVFLTGPVSFKEAVINSRSRIGLEKQLASIIGTLPPQTTFLMYLGDHVGLFQRAGIPLAHVINEGNHRPWKRPTDSDGLWEKAQAHPAQYANIAIAFENDPVATTVNQAELTPVLVLHVGGQAPATIYRTIKNNQQE
jgi:hypothetical protein